MLPDDLPEARRNLHELDEDVRRRLVALDEPVVRDDWSDVLRRAAPLRRRLGARTLTQVTAARVAVVTVAAGLVVGLWYPLLERPHGSGPSRVPAKSGSAVADAVAGSRDAAQPVVQLRTMASPSLRGGNQLLVVSSTSHGEFCYRWAGGGSGCGQRRATLGVHWGDGRVVGTVSSADVSSVTIEFTDGTAVRPQISWVAAPINAGFFRYDIPKGKVVAEVVASDGNLTRGEALWYV
jgi:hypothetical protein